MSLLILLFFVTMASYLMSLFQGHVASWNFTLTGSLKVSSFQMRPWLLTKP